MAVDPPADTKADTRADPRGRLVFHHTDWGGSAIYLDDGPYFDEEPPHPHNLRRIARRHNLDRVALTSPVLKGVLKGKEPYGTAWGGGSALFLLDDGDIAVLLAEQQRLADIAAQEDQGRRRWLQEMEVAIAAIPAPVAEERQRLQQEHRRSFNEGGYGYDPYEIWTSPGSLRVLDKHVPDIAGTLRALDKGRPF